MTSDSTWHLKRGSVCFNAFFVLRSPVAKLWTGALAINVVGSVQAERQGDRWQLPDVTSFDHEIEPLMVESLFAAGILDNMHIFKTASHSLCHKHFS
jgi:hypothetical protein